MVRHREFAAAGEAVLKRYTAGWYNKVEERLARLENLTAQAPLTVINTPGGSTIRLGKTIQSIVPVQLTKALTKFGSTTADVQVGTPLSSTLQVDSNFSITVFEVCNLAAKKDAFGHAYTCKNDYLERWIWMPCAVSVSGA